MTLVLGKNNDQPGLTAALKRICAYRKWAFTRLRYPLPNNSIKRNEDNFSFSSASQIPNPEICNHFALRYYLFSSSGPARQLSAIQQNPNPSNPSHPSHSSHVKIQYSLPPFLHVPYARPYSRTRNWKLETPLHLSALTSNRAAFFAMTWA